MHLLERLLAFDPDRRCSGEEALAHEYFADLEASDAEIGAARPDPNPKHRAREL